MSGQTRNNNVNPPQKQPGGAPDTMQPMAATAPHQRPHWQRMLWLAAGGLSLAAGLVGLLLPLLPTVPFVLLAAFCFSRGSERCDRWICEHRHFGPMVRDWRAHRAVPLRGKWMATVMMSISSVGALFLVPMPWGAAPAVCCAAVAAWMWSLPNAAPRGARAAAEPPAPPSA